MKKICLVLFTIVLTNILQANDFQVGARWISIDNGELPPNSWVAFRGKVQVEDRNLSEIEALIAVDSKYWLWVNGEMVVFEGGLKRGPKPGETYFDRIELEKYLAPGENTIAVLVWYFGKQAFSHQDSGKGAMLFQLEPKSGEKVVEIDWKARMHPAFGNTGKPQPNYRLPESNIFFDARKDIPGWTMPGFDDSGWSTPSIIAEAGEEPFGKLWERPIPQWYNSGLINYTDIEILKTGEGTIVKAYLPKNVTITPYLKLKSSAGELIDIRTDNYRGGSQNNVRTEYMTRDGEQEFETYAYMNGHHVIYTLPVGVEVIDLKYRETKYNSEVIGHFSCNDPFYNRLWEKAVNTLNVNMRDNFMDCPDRERAQWWGDVVILLGEILYTLDDNGKKAVEKAISNLVEWQKTDGVLYSPIPAGNWSQELPCQMLASVGEFGFWYYYFYSGNKELVTYVYPHVKKYLSLWKLEDTGLVEHRKGGWTWLDWGQQIDSALVYNTWYYMALNGASKMAAMQNDNEYGKECQSKMQSLKAAFNRDFWTGEGYRSAGYKGSFDDRGNGLAVVAGLAGPEKWDTIAKVLKENFNASPYTEKSILEALLLMDKTEQAQERLKKRYSKMVESPLTTLWEGWGIGAEGYGGGTYNHGWSGGPLTLMMQYIAGISPGEPGWGSYTIAPQLGKLNELDCAVPTPYGMIKTNIKQSMDRFRIRASIPENVEGKLVLPFIEGSQKIIFNGQLIWHAGKIVSSPVNIRDLSFCNGEITMKVTGIKDVAIAVER